MSINVTVSGNPVRINRGKMVTACNPAKTEFEKRRLMRLEQVRQQSKDIAENLRNKLKKGKSKCLSEIEKSGEVKLQNWQARKLLELQNQYQEALDDIGLGHKEATRVEEEEEAMLEQQENNERLARERGRVAAERLQIERNEENLRKAVPRQRKIFVNDMSKKGRSPSKKAKKGKNFDSDSENKVPQLILDESEMSDSSEGEIMRKRSEIFKTSKEQQTTEKTSKEQQTITGDLYGLTSEKGAQTVIHEPPVLETRNEFALDTRISERIKRRARLNPEVDYCDFILSPTKATVCTCCKCHKGHLDESTQTEKVEPERGDMIFKNNKEPEKSRLIIPEDDKSLSKTATVGKSKGIIKFDKKTDSSTKSTIPLKPKVDKDMVKFDKRTDPPIPSKPKVTLRSSKDRPAYIGTANTQPVQYYDHPNRYSRSYLPKTSHVEKIDDDDLIVSPNILSEEEIREEMRRRDLEAHLRGQQALEKEKIQREYRDLLKKLPALQKQERIFEIGTDKEKYHMSRDRLEDLEKRRQNRLDNAYEELFVRTRPPLVTLPKRKDDREARSLNLASWDVDFDLENRTDKLLQLLSNLKNQKDSLLKEMENTVPKETLKGSTDDVQSKSTDYTHIKSKSTDYSRVKRKRSRDERPLSPSASDVVPVKTKSPRKGTPASTGSSPSPRKKPKLKQSKIKILQNTSTQTTPKSGLQSAATSPLVHTPETGCTCKKDIPDDLCEIVIKIKEDEKPQVEVNPPGKNVKIITDSVDAPIQPSKKASWKETLTTHSGSSRSTTSTSYLEPPSSSRSQKKKSPEAVDTSKSTVSNGTPERQLDPRLLTYIKKLLNMSRASIDELTVSTASEVSTPSHSIMETPANNPLLQLRNVMRYFNLDMAELQKQISYVSDESSKHYNTSESVTVTTSSESENSKFQSCTEIDVNAKDPKNQLLQYADIAASCTQKINNLTQMIEKVRAEKKKMLESSTSGSDKDLTTTSYKDLPEKKPEEKSSSSNNNLDKLLTIDYSYAERLKQLTKKDVQEVGKKAEDAQPSDDELLNRLTRILQDSRDKRTKPQVVQITEKKVVQGSPPVAIATEKRTVEESKGGKSAGVVTEKTTVQVKPTEEKDPSPLFLDIPKLPRLEAPSLDKKRKKPPPSKGIRATAAVPHELSTILEADSQLSTKLDKSSGSKSSDDVSEMETMETMLVSLGMDWAVPTLKRTREALAIPSSSSGSGSKESGEVSLREFLSKISASSSSSLSESQGMSLIQVDNRRTSTPVGENGERKEGQPIFLTDSDVSSVREHSEKFVELNEASMSRTR